MLAGAGDADVEQPALLLDLRGGVGVHERQGAVDEADEEDGVPLEALGRVQRRERDALDGGGVLGGGALLELGDELAQAGGGVGGGEVAGEPVQRGQRLPALAGRAGAGRRRSGDQPSPPRSTSATASARPSGASSSAARAAPRSSSDRLAHLGAVEEALAAAHEVGHAGVGQRRLVGRGLGVDPVEHRDLARRACRRRPARAQRAATAAASAGSSSCSANAAPGRRGRWREQLAAARASDVARAMTALASADDLRGRAVVAHQPHLDGAAGSGGGSRAGASGDAPPKE